MRAMALAIALAFILPAVVSSAGGDASVQTIAATPSAALAPLADGGAPTMEADAEPAPEAEALALPEEAATPAALQSSAAPPAPAAYGIGDLIQLVNATNMEIAIRELQDFGTRYALAPNRDQVVSFIADRMSRSGAPTALETFPWNTYSLSNVVAELPTDSGNDGIILVCAHLDSYTGDPMNAPGADDDASGTAAVLLMAEIMAQFRWNYTLRFCAFNAEELGLVGSNYHADQALARGDPILAVLNMDMIGYGGGDTDVDLLYTNYIYFDGVDSKYIADAIVDADATYGLSIVPHEILIGSAGGYSDHYPFWQNGYNAICAIEQDDLDNPYYHMTTDTVDTLDLEYAADVVRAVFATACLFAEQNATAPDASPPSHSGEWPRASSLSPQTSEVAVDVSDPLGIDPSTIQLSVDGSVRAHALEPAVFGQRVSAPVSFADGTTHSARIRACDDSGNWLDWNWSFTIEAVPPEGPSNLTIDVSGNNIVLSWAPSPSPDVVEYRVFKAALPNAFNWGAPSATLTTTFSYTSVNDAGSLGVKFYAVRAVDAAGNLDPDPVILGKSSVRPNLGLTLFGNPFILDEADPLAAFHLLGTYWTHASAYDLETAEWQTRSRTAPEWVGNLRTVGEGQGFWLEVTASLQKLCLCGEARLNATVQLRQGWNLVAFPGYASATVATALAGVPYDAVQWGDPTATPYHLSPLAGTDYMMVGWGYWVHVTEDCVWTYAN